MKATNFNKIIATPEYKEMETIMVEKFKVNYFDAYEREASELDLKYYVLEFKIKLATVFDNYILDTDKMENVTLTVSRDGKLSIRMNVIRDGQKFFLETETIIAQGEIQSAHYRYIVKTQLRKQGGNDLVKTYKAKLSLEKKIDEAKKVIERLKKQQLDNNKELEILLSIPMDEVIKKANEKFQSEWGNRGIMSYTWEMYQSEQENFISKFDNEADFDTYKENFKNDCVNDNIEDHKHNILRRKVYVNDYVKSIKKEEQKLEKLTK